MRSARARCHASTLATRYHRAARAGPRAILPLIRHWTAASRAYSKCKAAWHPAPRAPGTLFSVLVPQTRPTRRTRAERWPRARRRSLSHAARVTMAAPGAFVIFPILAPTCFPSSCLGKGSVAQRHDPGEFTIPRRGTDDRRQHPHYAAWLPLAHGSYHGNHAQPCPSRVRALIQTSAH